MKIAKFLGTASFVVGLYGISASNALAADLEFYFPVGVNAPAVETIQALWTCPALVPLRVLT